MSSQVKAISFNEADCGKKVCDTKKRLEWIFQIGEQKHTFEIINSIISGKKVIKFDNQVIYTEKDFLNLKFDFTHNFDGHCFRITKTLDALSKFELRIDNVQFEQLYNRKFAQQKQEQGISDPFADFSNIGSNNKPQNQFATSNKPSNEFGQFDFDNFDVRNPTNQFQTVKIENPKGQVVEEINFLTNTNVFQTNCQKNRNEDDDFVSRFAKEESNIINEDVFATNAYVKYAKYKALNNGVESSNFSDNPQMQKENQGFSFNNDMNFEGIFNKAKNIAEKAKGKVTSLINGQR